MANLDGIAMVSALDGAVLVDKPAGISAHDVMKAVKNKFNLVKIGHGGTVDVTASGIFVLLVGDATRFSGQLMGADSVFETVFTLGRETDTGDRAGRTVSEKPVEGIAVENVSAALRDFRGDIYQSPPEFSAVRIPGKAGYEIVRTAEGEELRERIVHVYKCEVSSFSPPELALSVTAGKGVSVRSFARDLGRALGCGACVESCRRVSTGRHSVADAIEFMKLMEMHQADLARLVIPKRMIV